MKETTVNFFKKHHYDITINSLDYINDIVASLLEDMENGLRKEKSSQDMILTYTNPPKQKIISKSVIVIDAGGTNFRSCLVTFDENSKPKISELQKTKMPGIEKELSKKEFFDKIAENLEHLKDKANSIGFCFSYPMAITQEKDGILSAFGKEVKAPEVVGSHIGKELKLALKEHGWKNDVNVVMLNDTVAALLAGAADVKDGKKYSSYIGFILGTGLNSAYIQKENSKYPNLAEQIIVCESGRFAYAPICDFDEEVDKKSDKPGTGLMEKKSSGAYLGKICLEAIKTAAKEELFSKTLVPNLLEIQEISLKDTDLFLNFPYSTENLFGKLLNEFGNESDYIQLYEILDVLMDRCARLASAILVANVIKSEEGKNPVQPVCILCNGTTFYKTYKVKERIIAYLEELLVKKSYYYELLSVDDDITLGTAIAALS